MPLNSQSIIHFWWKRTWRSSIWDKSLHSRGHHNHTDGSRVCNQSDVL